MSMSQVNQHLHELPVIQSPAERAEEEIADSGKWLADVTASKLYKKRKNLQRIRLRLRELDLLIENYDKNWNQPEIAPGRVTREVTLKQTQTIDGFDVDAFNKKLDEVMR